MVLHAVNNNEKTFTLSICTSLKRDSLKYPSQVEGLHRFNWSNLPGNYPISTNEIIVFLESPPLCQYRLNWARSTSWGTLRSSVCAYTLLRRVLIHADCKWPSPTPSTTLPLYEMITCFIQTKLPLGQDFQRDATVFKWGQCTPEDDEINEVTLPSRHGIRKSSLCGLKPSTVCTSRSRRLPTILNIEWAGKKHSASLKLECQSVARTRDLRFPKQAPLTCLTILMN